MSQKHTFTTADYIAWDTATNLVRKLYRNGDFRMSLFVGCGIFFGLRVSDLLSLTWNEILGGDEFVLWLAGSGDKDADKMRIWEVFESTKFHYTENNLDVNVHCSAGVVFFDDKASCFEELYKKADKAMYQAKGAGRNTIVIA